ncbi:hypothetical protein DPMN_068241 [Dreissena polymorpha]|uniref:Uncharacterized protein n=2 Tax=Dreissena polymorpha TaxID=45954 RepID=A0A9D4BU48_DREPO|nr:hypothetical protein DPMN_068241 [Dreissena polymorpha]
MEQLSYNLQAILRQLEIFESSQEAIIKFVDISYREKLQEIREMRKNLNASLDKLEKSTLKKLNDIKTTLQTSLKKDIENCRILKDELRHLGEAVHIFMKRIKKIYRSSSVEQYGRHGM